ncbi:MAG: hypothetical protein EOR88_09325 [Mesorhizobium sp.]|nr:hypothetical protein EOA49_29340 [Mesorhizobium sp. M1A.F.Ca.IN.020.04.1.1]RUW07790.1 hypothetical protein EOA53_20280 [Mesorhizobium sp. M1A.F.Ca.IN.020.03.1.1]RWF70714.1 MAG: hypothetical protein EOQ34_17770 [Mesorhizobium sp.]RWG13717.1 MAG: hypothetical protein EOQ58_17045 [Mesorhizobium sp.]RWG29732.1 MAG: hypothetical protein EOQ61_17440 [Mesorhizobium sp.]
MCQRRPADPTDPGDAADLSIMGYFLDRAGQSTLVPASSSSMPSRFAQERMKINHFLTTAPESLGLR